MENNPEKLNNKDYYLLRLKEEIISFTNNGQNNDIVIIHNDYEMDSKCRIITVAKLFNPTYDAENQQFTISRLIPSPNRGEFASMLDYSFHENSDSIYCKQIQWDGHLDGHLPIREKLFSTADEIEYVFRCLDGRQLADEEATKVLRKHRKRLKSEYGIDNGNIPPGKFRRLLDRIFHDIEE